MSGQPNPNQGWQRGYQKSDQRGRRRDNGRSGRANRDGSAGFGSSPAFESPNRGQEGRGTSANDSGGRSASNAGRSGTPSNLNAGAPTFTSGATGFQSSNLPPQGPRAEQSTYNNYQGRGGQGQGGFHNASRQANDRFGPHSSDTNVQNPRTQHRETNEYWLKTNHFVIKHGDNCKLYRYNIEGIYKISGKKSKNTTSRGPSGDNEDTPPPKKNVDGQDLESADLKARQKRRLVVLLLDHLMVSNLQTDIASDFKETIIASQPLDLRRSGEFVRVDYYDEDQVSGTVHMTYEVEISDGTVVDISQHSQYLTKDFEYADQVTEIAKNAEVNTALNIVFSGKAQVKTVRRVFNPATNLFPNFEPLLAPVGSNKFFSLKDLVSNNIRSIEKEHGLVPYRGFFRSAKGLGQRFLLNINTTTSAFYAPVDLQTLVDARMEVINERSSLSTRSLEDFIRGLRVRTTYLKSYAGYRHEKIFTIAGLAGTSQYWADLKDPNRRNPPIYPWRNGTWPKASSERFMPENDDPPTKPVTQHFKDEYGVILNDDSLVVRLGRSHQTIPAACLEVLPGQVYRHTTPLASVASLTPSQNYKLIEEAAGQAVFDLENNASDDGRSTMGYFGLTIEGTASGEAELLSVKAEKLPINAITYRNRNDKSRLETLRDLTQWSLTKCAARVPAGGSKKDKDPYKWTICELKGPQNQTYRTESQRNRSEFEKSFSKDMSSYGMCNIEYDEDWTTHNDVATLRTYLHALSQAKRRDGSIQYQFVIIVLPSKSPELYPLVKQVVDQDVGINSVCLARGKQGIPSGYNALGNIYSKINLKIQTDSIGHSWEKKHALLEAGTMVVGMDVTHGGSTALRGVPSIAAMVASSDGDFNQWPASLKINPRDSPQDEDSKEVKEKKKLAMEKIVKLEEMLTERLDRWTQVNGKAPNRIIFYRDGLSESQFDMCRNEELPQLEVAMKARYDGNMPEFLLICAVKRHHTRFYPHPAYPNDTILAGKNNKDNQREKGEHLAPGTIVTDSVTYGKGDDFFLTSQNVILGTGRPTHYVILARHSPTTEELRWTLKDVAQATFDLCFMFGRCTKSVGLTAPAYLADKACDRARCYVRDQYTGHTAHDAYDETDPTHQLQIQVHDNLKNKMFYI